MQALHYNNGIRMHQDGARRDFQPAYNGRRTRPRGRTDATSSDYTVQLDTLRSVLSAGHATVLCAA